MSRITALILLSGIHLMGTFETSVAAQTVEPQLHWIWATPSTSDSGQYAFQTSFSVTEIPRSTVLQVLLDHCRGRLWINGQSVRAIDAFTPDVQMDVSDHLRQGVNTLTMICDKVPGPSALAVSLTLADTKATRHILTPQNWHSAVGHFATPSEIVDNAWNSPQLLGPVSSLRQRTQTRGIDIDHLDDYTQWKDALETTAGTDPLGLDVLPGFQATLLRSALDEEDSWVCLTQDDQGRWIIAMEKRGLLRWTPPDDASTEGGIERINENLAECRGLLYAHNCLYALANNDKALYRLRDTTGDDQFDEVKLLKYFDGDVGHGRNQITLGPDGKIYAIFGDAVYEPKDMDSRIPSYAHPNAIEKTRSGYVARCDPDGQNWEVVVRGLRNPFGIDFNSFGDMFTYDADAEYDMGSSWYRPTRVNHLVEGGDYGWRRVTGQWPPYFPDRPDMPQPTLDIGKGSPTAVEFGSGNQFPWPYRESLYVLDWAYGRILAVHLEPRGSSYVASAETFLRGRPLNVTDVEFGQDGAMYFVTGGRGTQSGLYRVAFQGDSQAAASLTEQQVRRQKVAQESRALLRRLQSTSASMSPDGLDLSWRYLGHSDPWIRHAARTLLESWPVDQWQAKALTLTDTRPALSALLALLHQGQPEVLATVGHRLTDLNLTGLPTTELIEWMFLADRCLSSDALAMEDRQQLLSRLCALYPQRDDQLDHWLSRLLSDHGPPEDFVPTTITLLRNTKSQERALHYLFVLRNVSVGWSPTYRDAYFSNLAEAKSWIFGEGMPTFLRLIEEAALKQVPEDQRVLFAERLRTPPDSTDFLPENSSNRALVKTWTLSDFDGQLDALPNRDWKRGRQLFFEAKCQACHRMGPQGGVSGPDLSALGRRFAPSDILTSILEPSRVVSAKYQNETFELTDGQTISGRVLSGDYRSEKLQVMPDLLKPSTIVEFLKADVEHREPTPLSPMPTGLLDNFQQDEILDLLAYLTRGSNLE
jgi:putative heme-binding domain-containing protein